VIVEFASRSAATLLLIGLDEAAKKRNGITNRKYL